MVKCCVHLCGSSGNVKNVPKISFHRIPAVKKNQAGVDLTSITTQRREKWLQQLNLDTLEITNIDATLFVCSKHFLSGKPSDDCDVNHPDWIPTQHLSKTVTHPSVSSLEKYMRVAERGNKKDGNVSMETTSDYIDPLWTSELFADNGKLISEGAKVSHEDNLDGNFGFQNSSQNFTLEEALNQLQIQEENLRKLEEKYQQKIAKLTQHSEELFSDLQQALHPPRKKNVFDDIKYDDGLMKFYTGFPTRSLFYSVFELCKPVVKSHPRQSLTLEEQFAMTLMKLRLNLKEKDLACRFNISQSCVSRYFNKWINIMYCRLPSALCIWPQRAELHISMPLSFRKKFKNCISIIDGFEIFCDRHKDRLDRATTYSSYKSHNTAKFVISITPQGTISFISRGFGGRTTDVEIVKKSGYLENLNAGDEVMADKGFTIEDLVGLKGAKLILPAFLGKQDQLRQSEVEESRDISNKRIHVERVIGHLRKKYNILRGPISVQHMVACDSESLTLIDKIVTVCCCLLNTLPGIVPFL